MSTREFNASVQYRDWSGAAKADDGDFDRHIRELFLDDGLIGGNDFVVGLEVWNGENTIQRGLRPLQITLYVVSAANRDQAVALLKESDPVPVRAVKRQMGHEEFFRKFKRFSIAMTPHDLPLLGRELLLTTEEAD